MLPRLPPHPRRLVGLRAAGEGRTDLRLDVACGRPGHALHVELRARTHGGLRDRAVQAHRGGDRPIGHLPRLRVAAHRVLRRRARLAAPHREHRRRARTSDGDRGSRRHPRPPSLLQPRRREGGAVDAGGRPRRSGRRHVRAGRRRPSGRREDRAPQPRHRHPARTERRLARDHRAGRLCMRARGERRRDVCAPDRAVERARPARHLHDPSLPRHRDGARVPRSGPRAAGGARRRKGLGLRPHGAEIRAHRHLREGEPQYRVARRNPLGSGERAVRARLRPHHAVAGERHGAHAGPGRTRHQAGGARRHHPSAGRQHAARASAGARQLLVLLWLPDRHRLGAGSRSVPRPVDGARSGGDLDARVRPAPLRRLRGSRVCGDQGARGLPAAPRTSVPTP